MSNSPSPLFVSHHDEQTGRESSASMPHGHDDKQSIETILSESKRLIKSVTLSFIDDANRDSGIL